MKEWLVQAGRDRSYEDPTGDTAAGLADGDLEWVFIQGEWCVFPVHKDD